jgi:hypothetical protein
MRPAGFSYEAPATITKAAEQLKRGHPPNCQERKEGAE